MNRSRTRWTAFGAGLGLVVMGKSLGLNWQNWIGFSIGVNLFVLCAIDFWVDKS